MRLTQKNSLPILSLLILASLAMGSKARATDSAKTCGGSFSISTSETVGSVGSQKMSAPRIDMMDLFVFLEGADPGKSKLTWNDFDLLEKAAIALQSNREKIEDTSEYRELFVHELSKLEKDQKGIFNRKPVGQGAKDSNLPLARLGLLQSYRLKSNRLLSLLPAPFNIALPLPINGNNKVVLVKQAEELMKKQSLWYQSNFASTGFTDISEYQKYINSDDSNDEYRIAHIRSELAAVNKDEYEFAIRRPEGARFWLTNGSGFQNQRETGGSKGTFDPVLRDQAEANGLGIEKSEYANVGNDIKPVYGYLSASVKTLALSAHTEVAQNYGKDIYYLKKEAVKERVSYFYGDSLHQLIHPREVWRSLFIPWTFRSLVSLGQILAGERKTLAPTGFKIRGLDNQPWAFIELQFWGPIGLEDVEKMVFEGTPPSGEFLQKLKQLNVQIYDGRKKPIKLWNGVN